MHCLAMQGAPWADDSKEATERAVGDLGELQRLASALQVHVLPSSATAADICMQCT
jgi:hypothetical protein